MCRLPAPSHKSTVISLKTAAAAVALLALAATPAFAQAAIQEPGAFAFYHPYLDVLKGGAPTPAAKLALEPPAAMQVYARTELPYHLQEARRRAHLLRKYVPASRLLDGLSPKHRLAPISAT